MLQYCCSSIHLAQAENFLADRSLPNRHVPYFFCRQKILPQLPGLKVMDAYNCFLNDKQINQILAFKSN